uniref:Uncharacterized protein n=1 Tax=Arundo donax TaxID=35708 RepID=A0A0A9HLJ6_ARUDO
MSIHSGVGVSKYLSTTRVVISYNNFSTSTQPQ